MWNSPSTARPRSQARSPTNPSPSTYKLQRGNMYQLKDIRYQATRRTPEELVKHLNDFSLDLKMSVGIWYFAPGGGRFRERYVPDMTLEERIDYAAGMAKYGIKGIEAHYPSEVNEGNLGMYKKLEQQSGIKLIACGPDSFRDPDHEFGTLSNPNKKHREKAQKTIIGALNLVKEAGCNTMGLWPGIDGFLYQLGTSFYDMW